MLRIGPSGNSVTFYESGYKHTVEAAQWLHGLGLNAFEYSFGRGINLSDETAKKIGDEFKKYDIQISAHAPYYINFANTDPEMIAKSVGYCLNSLKKVHVMGGERVIFHPAHVGKLTREEAFSLTKTNIAAMMEVLEQSLDFEYKLCCETMGKNSQIGTVPEVLQICNLHARIYPCFDFGHINSLTQGALKTKDDYRKIIELSLKTIGQEKTSNMHIHFSKIQYGKSGEIRHLTLADTQYGPEYAPLAELIDEYGFTPVILCESDSVMSDDAIKMKNMHKNI